MTPLTPRRRLLILVVAVLLLGGLGTGLVLNAASRDAKEKQPQAGAPVVAPSGRVSLTPTGRLDFLNAVKGPHLDEVVSVPAADPGSARTPSGVTCLRFYSAAGTGVCLQSSPGAVAQSNRALILDPDLRTLHTFPLAGTPSRARVSPSGHLAAWTVFVGGESYGAAFFSTRTSIVDTRTWQLTPSLEAFAITLDGSSYHATDINFWGVTFAADDDTFYATLGTGGHTYLVRGSIARHTVTTLTQNVECPSLSPDGTRIAFKRRVMAGAALWHEYTIDLRTMKQTPLAESRSVDDQATWLDDRTVAYALPTDGTVGSQDLWSVPADGTGKPQLVAPGAFSPAPAR